MHEFEARQGLAIRRRRAVGGRRRRCVRVPLRNQPTCSFKASMRCLKASLVTNARTCSRVAGGARWVGGAGLEAAQASAAPLRRRLVHRHAGAANARAGHSVGLLALSRYWATVLLLDVGWSSQNCAAGGRS